MRKLIWVCLLMVASVSWAQDQTSKLAIMPFAVRSPESEPQVRKNIEEVLTRQLGGEGITIIDPQEVARATRSETVETEANARSIGARLNADYVLFGSFNQIGNSISIDARLVDVSGRKKTQPLFAEEKGMENLVSAVNSISQQLGVHLQSKAIIADVKIEGNERIEPDAIKLNIKSKKGDILRPEQVSDDIKSIYKMGLFEKVEAQVTDSPGGKILTFVVQENPTIQELRITGNKKIKEKDILAAISTKAYSILQRNLINEDVQKILKLYQQKGYYNAQVKPEIEFPKDPRKATVVFNINENAKVFIKKITFQGNEHFSNRKLRGVMQTKQKSILSWITDRGILQRDILETDVDRLTVFYHDRGFMDAKVGTPEVSLKDDGFYIQVPIEEGKRYKVTEVRITGDKLDKEAEIEKKLQIKPSEYFSREELRKDMENISKAYMNEGFAYTEVNPDVKKQTTDQTTDVTYNVKKGEKVYIGTIFITGNTKTRDNVIRREIKLAEGDVFNATNLERSIQNLKKLDYFEEVEIVPTEGSQKDIMNLHVKVKEKLTGSISAGGGFSSDDGLFTSGEITQRNLFGRGQTLSLRAYLGQEAQRYILSFTEPYLFDTPLSGGIDVYNWVQEYTDFTKDATGFRLRTGYPFGNFSRVTAAYTFESDYVSDVSDDAALIIRDQEGQQYVGKVTFGAQRDTTDHPFLPTKGTINIATMDVASKYLGGDSDFLKFEYQSGVYIPLYWKLVGFLRGEAGRIVEIDEQVPIYERFFLGGINSLRGFEWGEVSPKQNGEYIGGLSYFVANVELLFPLYEKIGMRGVFFFDVGNSYLDEIVFDDVRTDAGAGIRWNSPLGPLRVEWGYNLDPRPGEDQYQWQFSAGAFF